MLPQDLQPPGQRHAGRAAEAPSTSIPMDIEGDAFGKIYEYFLGKFAMTEGQKGGEFFTPTSHRQADRRDHRAVPRPHLRPGLRLGRHVRAVRRASSSSHKKNPSAEIIALRAGEGGRDGAPVQDEPRRARPRPATSAGATPTTKTCTTAPGKFDFVMANPPFNVDRVDKEQHQGRPARFPFGHADAPTTPTTSGSSSSTAP